MIKRVLMYIALILSAFMLQNNFFASIKLINITPNLLLIITFVFGFVRGRTHGMAIGFACGILSDFFFGSSIGYYALIYMFIGYGNGILGQLFYTEFLNMPVVLCVINTLIFSLYVFITSFLFKGVTNFGYYFISIILPEIIYTSLITFIIYKPLRKLDSWMEKIETRSAKKFV